MNLFKVISLKSLVFTGLFISFFSAICRSQSNLENENSPFISVLGIAQDGGYPQAGSKNENSMRLWEDYNKRRRFVVCLALVDPINLSSINSNFSEAL